MIINQFGRACIKLGIDGKAPVGALQPDPCCPLNICNIDLCSLRCNFVNQLPRGPLWDRPKEEAIQQLQNGCEPCEIDTGCVTMVDHAMHTADILHDRLHMMLYPALTESNPFTANYSLDDWIERLGWSDCYDCGCSDCGDLDLSPIEVLGYQNGHEVKFCCPPEFPEELLCAVKRGIVHALARLDMGIRRNVDSINFVIAPLGARLEFLREEIIELDPRKCIIDDGRMLADCPPPTIHQMVYRVCPSDDLIEACYQPNCYDPCQCHDEPTAATTTACSPHPTPRIQSFYEPDCIKDDARLPPRIYPGVMAAECIVKSLVPAGITIEIERCCD